MNMNFLDYALLQHRRPIAFSKRLMWSMAKTSLGGPLSSVANCKEAAAPLQQASPPFQNMTNWNWDCHRNMR